MNVIAIAMVQALAAAAQSASQPHVSAVEVSATPAATVHANHIVHAGERVTIRVPSSSRFLGSERFKLYGVADAEVHVFAEAGANKRLDKLYWVQFESYLPDAMTKGYDYTEGNSRMILWNTPTWVRAGPVATGGPTRAGSDREHVQNILTRAGLTIPAEVMNVRMVQLLDDPQGTGKGKRELMIIYSEDLAPTGVKLADLAKDGTGAARWKAMEAGLIERAIKSVMIEGTKAVSKN